MTVCQRFLSRFFVYFVFIVCQLCNVRPQNNYSLFSFLHTDEKSPEDIYDSCLTMDSNKLGKIYLAITLYLLEDSKDGSCQSQNIALFETKKVIIRDRHNRSVCRTEITVSINDTDCENTVQYICQETATDDSIFFQECKKLENYSKKEETRDDSGAITMSEFPAPRITEYGLLYDFPRAHCNIKPLKSENPLTDQPKPSTNEDDLTEVTQVTGTSENGYPKLKYNLFAVIGSGLAGLGLGALVTSLSCIFMRKYKQSKNVKDAPFLESNMHLMVREELKCSIHSKEEGTIYQDISDMPGPSKRKEACALQSLSNVLVHDDYMEQRYSESPKSSTSANENASLSSQSSKNLKNQTKDSNVCVQQMYHTLSEDGRPSNKENLSAAIPLIIQETSDKGASGPSPGTGTIQRSSSEEKYKSPRDKAIKRQTSCSEFSPIESSGTTTEASPDVYHVLQEKREHQTDIYFDNQTQGK